ncbi:sterol desaturase family protein [Calothrix sp. 336/3]|uniref:sterol desaturase family protein n=1 Tax=Calothrix sp. 336/3 TaxID=1337936 RepID=UPI0004E3C25F|nr:sterol desaturase family protein [Calothrix sp. 336/3]AKG22797.1 sterol desaturase [Calothrix sp. 336/3]
MVIFLTFIILVTVTVIDKNRWSILLKKKLSDWFLDTVGLLFQGIIIPVLQYTIVFKFYQYFLPHYQGSLNCHPLVGFCLSFICVDYLYYWNHRLLHSSWLWKLHQVHHTVTDMDVFGTSRNTLWTSFLIIYLWIHPLFIYLLDNPTGYIFGASLTSALDLWRHSVFSPSGESWLFRCLSPWLILPQDHGWHHAASDIQVNFGGNWKIWDRLHQTYWKSSAVPEKLGIEVTWKLSQKLLLF